MASYSSEKYRTLLNEFGQIITLGANCCASNPCSGMATEVGEFKSMIDKIVNGVEWDDECGATYKSALESLSSSLDTISGDISSNWTNGEKLYKDAETYRGNLETLVAQLETAIDNKPNSTDSKYTAEGSTANYSTDYSAWITNVESLIASCDEQYDAIITNIDGMNGINFTSVGDVNLRTLGLTGVIDMSRILATYRDTPASGFTGETTFGLTFDNHDYNGVMTDRQLNILMAIVAGEAYTPSPDDCLAVVSTILNRADLAAFTHSEPYGNPYDIATARQQFTAYRYYSGKGNNYRTGGYTKFLDSNGNYTGPDTVRQAVSDGLSGVRNTNALYYLANFCTYNGNNMASEKGNRFQLNPNRKKHK